MAQSTRGETATYTAGGAITKNRLVKMDSTDHTVVVATNDSAAIVGVALDTVAAGEQVTVHLSGIARVEASGSIGIGLAVTGAFDGLTAEDSEANFAYQIGQPVRQLILHAVFVFSVVFVVSRGLQGGIERMAKLVMPALGAILLFLVGYCLVTAIRTHGRRLAIAFLGSHGKLTRYGDFGRLTHWLGTLGRAATP